MDKQFISNRMEHLHTSLAKRSLSTSPHNTNNNNNNVNNNNTGSDYTIRVLEPTATSSINSSMQLRVAKKPNYKPNISKPSSILLHIHLPNSQTPTDKKLKLFKLLLLKRNLLFSLNCNLTSFKNNQFHLLLILTQQLF